MQMDSNFNNNGLHTIFNIFVFLRTSNLVLFYFLFLYNCYILFGSNKESKFGWEKFLIRQCKA